LNQLQKKIVIVETKKILLKLILIDLDKKIDEIQQKLEQFTQKDTNKIIIVDNDQIDWNRLIYIRQQNGEYIELKL